jgi:DNA-binding MarR family transcriptional regulator
MEMPTTGALLWRVVLKWRAAVDRAVAPFGLTHAQYSLLGSLYALSRDGTRPSQRELADFAGLDPIYVSRLIKTLEKSGLVARERHPSDTRALQIGLTEHAAALFPRVAAIVRSLNDELLEPIGGSRGRRNQELVDTLQLLLGRSDALLAKHTDSQKPEGASKA